MNKTKLFEKRKFIFLLLILSLIGVVLFFPVNIQNRHTCLYQRWFVQEYSHQHNKFSYINEEKSNSASKINETGHPESLHDEILHGYLTPFGLLWWGSLIVGSISVYWLRKGNAFRYVAEKAQNSAENYLNTKIDE